MSGLYCYFSDDEILSIRYTAETAEWGRWVEWEGTSASIPGSEQILRTDGDGRKPATVIPRIEQESARDQTHGHLFKFLLFRVPVL